MQRGGLVVIFYSAVVVVRHKLHITAMEPGYGQLTVALDSTAEILKGAWIIFLKVPAVSAHVVGFGATLTAADRFVQIGQCAGVVFQVVLCCTPCHEYLGFR